MEAVLEHSPTRGRIDRPPSRPVRCSSREEMVPEHAVVGLPRRSGGLSSFRGSSSASPAAAAIIIAAAPPFGGVRRTSSATKKNQAQTSYLYRRLWRSCCAFQEPQRRSGNALLVLLILVIMMAGVGVILARRSLSTASFMVLVEPIVAGNAHSFYGAKPVEERTTRVGSTGLQQVLSMVDDDDHRANNPRIRGLLAVLRSAHQHPSARPPWPAYLTLHRGATPLLPPVDASSSTASCIVTAYFRVKGKHHESRYEDEWMGNMLSLHDCLVIFCEPDLVSTMLQARTFRPTVVIAMELVDLPIASYYHPSALQQHETATAYWEHQLEIDPERRLHKSYQLFWIWLSKTWFVTTAALLQQHLFVMHDGEDSSPGTAPSNDIQTWMWADIGSFRNERFANARLIQHPEALLDVDNVSSDEARTTVVWMAHHAPNPPADPYWNAKLDPDEKVHYYHGGSHGLAASVEAWVRYYLYFVDTLDEYGRRGLFVGEDQCVLQTTCLLHPESCAYLSHDRVNDHRYFGLRSALRFGNTKQGRYELWRPPPLTTTTNWTTTAATTTTTTTPA